MTQFIAFFGVGDLVYWLTYI